MRFFVLILLFQTTLAYELDFLGDFSYESRKYFKEGAYSGQHDKWDHSLVLSPKVEASFFDDSFRFHLHGFYRYSHLDKERTHGDIREASFLFNYHSLDFLFGISKVYWGVAESYHLVDIINQVDFVENIDAEDKLGEAMLNISYDTDDFGNFSFFYLPYFRERAFPGINGRLRTPLVVDSKNSHFTRGADEKRPSFAFRWSHFWNDFEWGLFAFKGVDRTPLFITDISNPFRPKISTLYYQSEQFGLDLQYTTRSILWKLELLRKDADLADPYVALVGGFEYTLQDIAETGASLGLLYEYIYDERKQSSLALYDHSFLGLRLALDEDSLGFTFLAGATFRNFDGNASTFRLEASRRINDNFKWEVEVSSFMNREKSPISLFAQDDYAQATLSYYW